MKRNFLNKINIVNNSIRPTIINEIKVNLAKILKLKKLNSSTPYIGEFTVFIIVSVPILNAFSKSIPEIVSNRVMVNKEITNIIIVKKYLLISSFLIFTLDNEILFK